MLRQREIKAYIASHLLPPLLRQVPGLLQSQPGILTLAFKLDITKTLRHNLSIGLFIIGDYPKFIQLVEETMLEGMVQSDLEPPHYGVNIAFSFANCPLPRHNLESVEFLTASFEQSNGVLIYLKDAHILKAHQPQLYLAAWEQVWAGMCSCAGEKQLVRRKQSLLQIVKSKSQNMRQASISQSLRCAECNAKLRLAGVQDKYFLNCQKLRVLINMRESSGSKEELFQKNELDIFLDENHTDRFSDGDIIDMCCYYSSEPRVVRIAGQEVIVGSESGLFMICSYPCSALSNSSSAFFSSLAGLSCEYIRCDDPRDEETVCYNFRNLSRTVNLIKFPYLHSDSLSTLKLIVINSLFNQLRQVRLHFLAVTDEVNLLQRALSIPGVTIKKWPSLYDHATLIQFLNCCHNCVLLVTNPNKKDFEYINHILNQQLLSNINFTLWILTEPNNELRKEVALEKVQIVIDLSAQKNYNICRAVYDAMVDQQLQSFIQDSNELILTVPKSRKERENGLDNEESFEGVESNQQEMEQENRIALQLLEKYFVRAREYKTVSMNSLENIKHIAEGFACFRGYLREREPSQQRKQQKLNILDAIMAIFIEEETSRNKHSSSNTLFSNEISKLMLNEGDCELSFWDYEVDENEAIGESRKLIRKEEMFKRMVGKLMSLLYGNELL